jgi:hypothetical protein
MTMPALLRFLCSIEIVFFGEFLIFSLASKWELIEHCFSIRNLPPTLLSSDSSKSWPHVLNQFNCTARNCSELMWMDRSHWEEISQYA